MVPRRDFITMGRTCALAASGLPDDDDDAVALEGVEDGHAVLVDGQHPPLGREGGKSAVVGGCAGGDAAAPRNGGQEVRQRDVVVVILRAPQARGAGGRDAGGGRARPPEGHFCPTECLRRVDLRFWRGG
jgi:hypothetical protein